MMPMAARESPQQRRTAYRDVFDDKSPAKTIREIHAVLNEASALWATPGSRVVHGNRFFCIRGDRRLLRTRTAHVTRPRESRRVPGNQDV
jgi:hypothetical protein